MTLNLTNEEKLDEIHKLTLENNEILKSLRRQQRFGIFFKVLYWVVILASIGGAYYYIRPVITAFTANNQQVQDSLNRFDMIRQQFPEAQLLEKFFGQQEKAASTTKEE